MYGYLYMQLGPPQIVNQAHVLSSLILWLHRYILYVARKHALSTTDGHLERLPLHQ